MWFQKISRPPPWRELEIPGGWGGQRPRKFQEGGGLDHKITFQGVNIISFPTCPSYRPGRSFLGHKLLEIYHLRLFLLILTGFPFFQKRFGCNFKGIEPSTTRFIACPCIRPPLLVSSQNINVCNT